MRNADKIVLAKVGKISSSMNLDSNYMWVIRNIDIDAAKDLRLINIKKYWRFIGQIEKEANGLYRD